MTSSPINTPIFIPATCFQSHLIEQYKNSELNEEDSVAFLEHLPSCKRCKFSMRAHIEQSMTSNRMMLTQLETMMDVAQSTVEQRKRALELYEVHGFDQAADYVIVMFKNNKSLC